MADAARTMGGAGVGDDGSNRGGVGVAAGRVGGVVRSSAVAAAAARTEDESAHQQQRVTAHSYGALNVTHATDECWLVRFPQKLAAMLEKVPEGTPIGELVFTKGGSTTAQSIGGGGGRIQQQKQQQVNNKPSLTVHIDEKVVHDVVAREKAEADAAAAAAASTSKKLTGKAVPGSAASTGGAVGTTSSKSMPLNYSLQAMTKKIPVMHPFTRNPKNGSVTILGQISRTANLQVEQGDSTYRELLKDRLVATNITSSRFVKPVEAAESVMNKQQQSGSSAAAAAAADGTASRKKTFGNAVLHFGKRMLEASQGEVSYQQQLQQYQDGGPSAKKKARQFSPDQPLRSVVFELFGQQQYWTVKDLKAAAVAGGATNAGTKAGEAEIRTVLREIGEYHRSGDHKNMWELRKEFQQQS